MSAVQRGVRGYGRGLVLVFALVALVAALAAPGGRPPARAQAAPVSETFGFTGGLQAFTVPAGVTALTVEATGAGGGPADRAAPGRGVRLRGDFAVAPGEQLTILVGSRGGVGVFNGGGGGGSFVWRGTGAGPGAGLLLAAGGGGGAGCANIAGVCQFTPYSAPGVRSQSAPRVCGQCAPPVHGQSAPRVGRGVGKLLTVRRSASGGRWRDAAPCTSLRGEGAYDQQENGNDGDSGTGAAAPRGSERPHGA